MAGAAGGLPTVFDSVQVLHPLGSRRGHRTDPRYAPDPGTPGRSPGAAPSAAIIDSASVRGAETVGADTRGYDAGKKVNGRKRHIAVDATGLLLCVIVIGASVQDRDGARPLLEMLAKSCRRVQLVWADGGYAGKLVIWANETLNLAPDHRQTLR